jgi:DNA repair exonuclease SbcCD nuclease subunit
MPITFIHTADWQIGKPFAGVDNADNRSQLGAYRIRAIHQIAQLSMERKADFVLVAGDLWDSSTPTKKLVSETLSAIGKIPCPVYVITGNHDHGAMGTVWSQEFFLREQEALAPNLNVLLQASPIELNAAILLPCPLLRRHELEDLSQWLRAGASVYQTLGNKPRIVLAHGSVTSFGSASFEDEEEIGYGAANLLNVDRLAIDELDYIALGDWHGTKQILEKCWYSGTPEPDRFPKGENHDQGNVLVVTVARASQPIIEVVKTGTVSWRKLDFHFTGEEGLQAFSGMMDEQLGTSVGRDLVHLSLKGSLGLEDFSTLSQKLETYEARLIRIKLDNQVQVNPTTDELDSLRKSAVDPLIARVADKLHGMLYNGEQNARLSREALKQLYFTTKTI